MARLSPVLYKGIEDVLHRRIETFNPGGSLNFVVHSPINGFYRVVGATYPTDHPMRQNSSKVGEGVRGYFTEHKKAGYMRTYAMDRPEQGNRTIFDRDGQVLGEVPWLEYPRPGGILNRPLATKWFYYRPVFEKSAVNPWSDRMVGMIIVHSSADDADSLFRTAEFQQQVDSIATEVSPYLDAIQVLMGEEKL